MFELSVLIPARNEMFLQRTIDDVLENSGESTEVIAVLDGYWPDPGIPSHPRVTVLHHESIGQRAATNEAARVSRAKYVMKLDAHCAMDKGFDAKLIKAAEELGPDVTQVPAQFNLHVYDWQCDGCGTRTYQGPTPKICKKCGHVAHHREMVWKPRKSRLTTAWRFDSDLKFQYFGKFKHRPEGKGDITDTMSLLGACWFLSRKRYWELDGMDENHGSWGQMGVELACKSWLSGGRLVTNHQTHFSHMFRTQGKDFGFPYPISGNQVNRARKHSRNLWLNNSWPKQTRPLSWLIEKFKPVPDWHDESGAARLAEVTKAGVAFAVTRSDSLSVDDPIFRGVSERPFVLGSVGHSSVLQSADSTYAERTLGSDTIGGVGEGVPLLAMSLSGVDRGRAIPSHEIVSQSDESQVGRVAASGIVADKMVELGDVSPSAVRDGLDEKSIHESVGEKSLAAKSNASISTWHAVSAPLPAASIGVDSNLGKDSRQSLSVEVGNCEKMGDSHSIPPLQVESRSGADDASTPSAPPTIIPHPPTKGVIFYTDNRLDPTIAEACQRQLSRAVNGNEIVAVSLAPLDFGDIRVVMAKLERGYLTMFRQILAGLEISTADVIHFAEHDLLYDPSHFDFTPPSDQIVYYNCNTYKVNAETGDALHYITKQTSGLCAYRELLLEHYRKRVALVEKHGFTRKMGFEPGTHGRAERVDDLKSEAWMSEFPNIDIRHGKNLTPSRWRQDQFRNQRSCRGWRESDEVPGWGRTKGRFSELLRSEA